MLRKFLSKLKQTFKSGAAPAASKPTAGTKPAKPAAREGAHRHERRPAPTAHAASRPAPAHRPAHTPARPAAAAPAPRTAHAAKPLPEVP